MIRSILKTSLVAGAALLGAQAAQATLYEINANGTIGLLHIDQSCRSGTIEFTGRQTEQLNNVYCSQYGNELRIRFERPQAGQVYDGVGSIYGFNGSFRNYNGQYPFSAQLAITQHNLNADLEINANGTEGILKLEQGCNTGTLNFIRNQSEERVDNLRCYSVNGVTKVTFLRVNAGQTYALELQQSLYGQPQDASVRGTFRNYNGTYNVSGSQILLNRALDGTSFDVSLNGTRGILNIHPGSQSGNLTVFGSYGGSTNENLAQVHSYLRLTDNAQVLRFLRVNAGQAYKGVLRGREITGTFINYNGQYSWNGYLTGGITQPPIDYPPIEQPGSQCPPGTVYDPSLGRCVSVVTPPHTDPGNQCPPGTVFDPSIGRCVSVVTPPRPRMHACRIHGFTSTDRDRETAIQEVLLKCAQGSGGYVCARSQVTCSVH